MDKSPNDRDNLKYLIQLRRTKDEIPSPCTLVLAILAFSNNITELEKMQVKLLRVNLKWKHFAAVMANLTINMSARDSLDIFFWVRILELKKYCLHSCCWGVKSSDVLYFLCPELTLLGVKVTTRTQPEVQCWDPSAGSTGGSPQFFCAELVFSPTDQSGKRTPEIGFVRDTVLLLFRQDSFLECPQWFKG